MEKDNTVKGIDKPQTIVRLETKNVKRIRAVEITPDGQMVVLGGNNRQGKTSILDSITYALAGGRAICDKPLREGEKKGHVVVETEDLVVRRTFTNKGGGTLKVTLKSGKELKPAQTVLDKLCGSLTFDPLKFMTQEREKQAKTLRELLGLDLSNLDNEYKELFDERTAQKRELKKLKARLENCKSHPGVGVEEICISELMADATKAIEHNAQIAKKESDLETKREKRANSQKKIEELKQELKQEEEKLEQIITEGTKLRAEVDAAQRIDTKALNEKIKNIEQTNEKVKENQEYQRLEEQTHLSEEDVDNLTERMEKIIQQKNRLISDCKMPVDGLSFNLDGEVTLNGLPLDQCSGEEELTTSVAIGISQNPNMKIMLVRNAYLMEKNAMKQLAVQAADADAQLWVERVGDGDDNAIIIEDGMVV
jgi:DNA repair exonuclease SbcCD ATPase subunit